MHTETEHLSGLRTKNRAAVLLCLHRSGDVSRKQLSEKLGLTPAAMTKIVSELLSEGLVSECGAVASGSVGRREIRLTLRAESRCALGVSLGLGGAILSAVQLDGSAVFSETVPLPVRAAARETLAMLSSRLLALAAEHNLARDRIVGIGVAVRGVIGADGRTVKHSFDALDTADFPICDVLEDLTGFPALLSNNVRALSLAQMFLSREPNAGSMFFVRCGAGIGAALSLDGRILTGSRGQCAEIGHIPVIRRGGKPCHCGKSGCLETVASPVAIREDAQAILSETDTPLLWQLTAGDPAAVTTELVLDAARGGDMGAASVADRAIDALSGALQHVIYLIDPKEIVLYGAIFEHPYYLSRLQAETNVGIDAAHAVPLHKSRFNNRLEALAAGLLAVAQFIENGGTSL